MVELAAIGGHEAHPVDEDVVDFPVEVPDEAEMRDLARMLAGAGVEVITVSQFVPYDDMPEDDSDHGEDAEDDEP